MLQMIYLSKACGAPSEEDISEILSVARRNNSADGLTGLLIYGGGFFMQMLEGPDAALFKRYLRILDDPRHTACSVVAISPSEERLFGKWSMACVPSTRLANQDVAALREFRLNAVKASIFRSIMGRFHDRLVKNSGNALEA